MDIDFEKLADSTDDEMLKSLDQFFDTMMPTRKNDYTGMLKDYNLITICAESFCPYFISEELTPTLYKLSNNGIVFNNYYGTGVDGAGGADLCPDGHSHGSAAAGGFSAHGQPRSAAENSAAAGRNLQIVGLCSGVPVYAALGGCAGGAGCNGTDGGEGLSAVGEPLRQRYDGGDP